MSRTKKIIAIAVALPVLALVAYLWTLRMVIFPPEHSFEENQALLMPHLQVLLPEAEGPRPAVLFFHGCGGPAAWDTPRAQRVVDQGYVAVIVDSYTGRNLDWELTCNGQALLGNQRAADVLVALDYARQHPAIDAERLFLVGFSHGGWTILEALAGNESLPQGLLDSPGGHLDGVRGLVAWYPYCGMGVQYSAGWERDIPVLILLAEEDRTTAVEPCVEIAVQEAEAGRTVDYVVYPGVDHGFDLENAPWVRVYDPEIHQQSMSAQADFFQRNSG